MANDEWLVARSVEWRDETFVGGVVSLCTVEMRGVVSRVPNADVVRYREGWDMGMFSDQLRQVLRRLGRAPLFTMVR